MYVAVIEPHPALLGPFAILLLSVAISPLILRNIGNGITKNYVRSWPRQRAAIMSSPSMAPPACGMLHAGHAVEAEDIIAARCRGQERT